MTPHCARAVRGRGGVVQADLLQLVPIFIPENGAPQLRTSKMSPSARLWAQLMSKRELSSLGGGAAAQAPKRGAAAVD